jgi:two-component system, NtrC family, sensor histidine kinase HupT/HoxJ
MVSEERASRSSMPAKTVPPTDEASFSDEEPPSSDLDHTIAVLIDDPSVRLQALEILAADNCTTTGEEGVPHAAVVLVDAPVDPAAALKLVRANARSDAAILVLVGTAVPALVDVAHRSGAYACVRTPLVAAELSGLVASALERSAAREQLTNLARQLDLQSHLASIGRMSAGLCHELSNPLAAAKANVDTLDEYTLHLLDAVDLFRPFVPDRARVAELVTRDEVTETLGDTSRALARMDAVLGIVKGLSHPGKRALGSVDVVDVVRNAVADAAEPLAGVAVEQVIDDPARAIADPWLLRQILINLATNAAHAAKSLSSPRVRFHVYATSAHTFVSVRDNGPGIALSVQHQIFEPFYTTKRAHGGTGLGLSLCREYALQMGAQLSVWSVPGRGACFRLRMAREGHSA